MRTISVFLALIVPTILAVATSVLWPGCQYGGQGMGCALAGIFGAMIFCVSAGSSLIGMLCLGTGTPDPGQHGSLEFTVFGKFLRWLGIALIGTAVATLISGNFANGWWPDSAVFYGYLLAGHGALFWIYGQRIVVREAAKIDVNGAR